MQFLLKLGVAHSFYGLDSGVFFFIKITINCTINAIPNPKEEMMNKDKIPSTSPIPFGFINKLRKNSAKPRVTPTKKILKAIFKW